MPQTPILVPTRLRRPPKTGWSWVDRRFVREHAAHLSRNAVLLYFFLTAVADKHGVSFYGDGTLATLLRMTLPALIQARNELLERDLIAHDARFTQVLSLLPPGQTRRCEPGGGLMNLGDILHRPLRRHPLIAKGACHEHWTVGRDSPSDRDREALRPSHFTTTTVLAISRCRGAQAGSAPRAGPRAAPASWTCTGPRSMLCLPGILTSRPCESTRKSPAASTGTPAA